MAVGLFIAGTQRYRAVYAAIYLLPLLFRRPASPSCGQGVLSPEFGGLAWFARHLNLGFLNRNWLGSPGPHPLRRGGDNRLAVRPFPRLDLPGRPAGHPPEMYEAALVDGASLAQTFRHVTLPQLRYTIVTSSTLIVVGSLTYFDIIFILTQGGPGDSTGCCRLTCTTRVPADRVRLRQRAGGRPRGASASPWRSG